MKIGKAIFNVLFWVVFLNLFNYHIHNTSIFTSIGLAVLMTINLVENVIGFKQIVNPFSQEGESPK